MPKTPIPPSTLDKSRTLDQPRPTRHEFARGIRRLELREVSRKVGRQAARRDVGRI